MTTTTAPPPTTRGPAGRHTRTWVWWHAPMVPGVVHSLVYPSVTEGEYELYALPAGPVVMTASVIGGQVTRNRWPG